MSSVPESSCPCMKSEIQKSLAGTLKKKTQKKRVTVNVNERPLSYRNIYCVFPSFIQRFNAKDA